MPKTTLLNDVVDDDVLCSTDRSIVRSDVLIIRLPSVFSILPTTSKASLGLVVPMPTRSVESANDVLLPAPSLTCSAFAPVLPEIPLV